MTLGEEFRVNTTTSFGGHNNPTITHLKDGDFLVTWDLPAGVLNGNDVVGQRFQADGTAIGGEFTINTTTKFNQGGSAAASFEDGGFIVAWSSPHKEENVKALNYDVMAQRFDANATPIGSEFQVNNDYVRFNQGGPALVTFSSGEYVIQWDSLHQDGNFNGVYAQRYNADNSTKGDEYIVNTTTSGNQQHSAVQALDDGSYWTVWESRGSEPNDPAAIEGYGVFGQIYNADGTANGAEFQINTHYIQDQGNPSIAKLKNGNIIIVWESFDQDGSYHGIYGQEYTASGTTVGDEFQINTFTASSQRVPRVTAFDTGGYVVAWYSNAQETGDSLGFQGLYGQKFNEDGTPDGEEFHINDITQHSQESQELVSLGGGSFAVVWKSSDVLDVQNNGINGIKAKIYGPNTEIEPSVGGANQPSNENDTLVGTPNDDNISALEGDDTVDGLAGNDTLAGGNGNDTLFSAMGNNIMHGGQQNDSVITLSGNANSTGYDHSDFVMGGFQSDILKGEDGNDVLRGDASDIIGGSDRLDGGGGNDTLMGGKGSDIFMFRKDDGHDVIGQFKVENVSFDATTGYSVAVDAADFQIGLDQIEIIQFVNVTEANVMDFVTDVDGHALFSAEGTEIEFYDILTSQLSASDFTFIV